MVNNRWKLDKNGYAPSLFVHFDNQCDICHRNLPLQRHEIFHGAVRRERSKEYGLWLNICFDCHNKIHNGKLDDTGIKKAAQAAAEHHYGWSHEDFIALFGKNYLDDLLED